MRSQIAAGKPSSVSLEDKWTISDGRVFLNGTQAIARALLAQHEIDCRNGLNTAGYITGYRGSPLGNVDTTLWSITERLKAANITFQPGVNEDLAATAVRGTQQLEAVPGPSYDGVFAAWYGKGPGVDRSGDALKHGNFAGTHENGGVLVYYGDDHASKSSTVAHHSEQAMAASFIPSLYPVDVGEIFRYSLLGYALSRYSGSWVGVKCVNEVAEQTLSVDMALAQFEPVLPDNLALPPEGIHIRGGTFNPLREEQIVVEHRLPRVQRFVRANGIDQTVFRGSRPRLGLVTAGKSFGDVRTALRLLNLDPARAATLGISLYKIGCVWPLEPESFVEFAAGHATLFVIEEKSSFLELQASSILINSPERPILIGKKDETGAPLLSSTLPLEPIQIALAILDRLSSMGIHDPLLADAKTRLTAQLNVTQLEIATADKRSPFFCSGCPHSRSTRIPEGSLSLTGIGCHTMASFVRPKEALLPTQMGGEGANWIGLAPFTTTKHIFQNMGDGTYYHSGLLAIRAAVAARVNITYKILYNDAVAMTGGQPVDGPLSVAEIAQQVRHEGVGTIVIVSDQPDQHRRNPTLPPGVRVEHRDDLDGIQRELRELPGCTVLIYEQTCAAEKRRRRKRKQYPDPQKRLYIAEAVCEGCGDCSVQSTCVSLVPVETEFGTKRQIDQSSCNKDYSCLNGFCPSFITVYGAEPRKPDIVRLDPALYDDLAQPSRPSISESCYNIMIAGIGGTGVITVSAILGMAAHLDGLAASLFDMTGLAQKNGAVYSHVRIARSPEMLNAQRLGNGESDVLLAFDLLAALSPESAITLGSKRTKAVVNSDVAATATFQFDRNAKIDSGLLLSRLAARLAPDAMTKVEATRLAISLLGDSIGTNLFLVGIAAQRGFLPMTCAAIEAAVRLNGTAIDFNLTAFRLGRLFAAQPNLVEALIPTAKSRNAIEPSLDEVVTQRVAYLTQYQSGTYAARYRAVIDHVRHYEGTTLNGSHILSKTVARNYAKFLAFKDEYEVARLLTSPTLKRELRQKFSDTVQVSFNLAPPILNGELVNGRPRKRAFNATIMEPFLKLLARLKILRGTPLDPFGYSTERRMERELITHYEALIERVLPQLNTDNYTSAVELLGLADQVRGFGPVKQQSVADYYPHVAELEKAFEIPEDFGVSFGRACVGMTHAAPISRISDFGADLIL